MLEKMDEFVRTTYAITNLVSCELNGAVIYFNEGKPWIKFTIYPGQIVAEELFPKTGVSIVKWKEKDK